MTLSRRGLITGLVSFIAAPAIVRASSLMVVKDWRDGFTPLGPPHFVGANWLELSEITRTAFVPLLFVQIYRENPLFLDIGGSECSGM